MSRLHSGAGLGDVGERRKEMSRENMKRKDNVGNGGWFPLVNIWSIPFTVLDALKTLGTRRDEFRRRSMNLYNNRK